MQTDRDAAAQGHLTLENQTRKCECCVFSYREYIQKKKPYIFYVEVIMERRSSAHGNVATADGRVTNN